MPNLLKTSSFRAYLPDLNSDRFTSMKQQDCYQYGHHFKESKQPPWLHALYEHWQRLHSEPFKGVTADGTSDMICAQAAPWCKLVAIFLMAVKAPFDPGYISWRTRVFLLATSSMPQTRSHPLSAKDSVRDFSTTLILRNGGHGPTQNFCSATRASGSTTTT